MKKDKKVNNFVCRDTDGSKNLKVDDITNPENSYGSLDKIKSLLKDK